MNREKASCIYLLPLSVSEEPGLSLLTNGNTLSRISSLNGVGKGSCTQASLIPWKSTQMRIPPIFLPSVTIGLI